MSEYFTLTARRCKECGRILVSEESVKRGYGCQCARKAKEKELDQQPLDGQISLLDAIKNRKRGMNNVKDKNRVVRFHMESHHGMPPQMPVLLRPENGGAVQRVSTPI